MSYEFAPGSQVGPIAHVPNFWNTSGRIYHELPNNPIFVFGGSVIEDTKTGHIGIDTNDHKPPAEAIVYGINQSIGLMHVVLEQPPIDGYIVDLRYRTALVPRELGFTYVASAQAAELNEMSRNVPAIGAIFRDAEEDSLHFQCEEAKRARLLPFAASLIEFVDEEYQKRGVPTLGVVAGQSESEPSSDTVARDLQ